MKEPEFMTDKSNAGEFSDWPDEFVSTMKGVGEGNVPCGECVGCCTSSKFIHLRPTVTAAIRVIPDELMFQAPGLPEGYYLLGYDANGHCPMFRAGKCSIYECRPATCRQYDCRVLAIANVAESDDGERITKKVNSWQFECGSARSFELYDSVKLAVEFLSTHVNEFPPGFVPTLSAQVAVMAIRVHSLFIGHTMKSVNESLRELVGAVVQECADGS